MHKRPLTNSKRISDYNKFLSTLDKKNSKEFPLLYKLKSELNSVLPNTNSKETTSSSSKSNSNYQPYSKNQF